MKYPPPPHFLGEYVGFFFLTNPQTPFPADHLLTRFEINTEINFLRTLLKTLDCNRHFKVDIQSICVFFSNEQIIWFPDKNFKHGVNQSKTVKRMITWVKIKIELIDNQLLTNVFDDVREKMVSTHYTVTSNFLTVRDEYSENSIFQSSQSMFAGFI